MSKRAFTSMYLAVVEELRGLAIHLIPQVRWSTWTDVYHDADGVICMERRFVIYRQWLGRTYDYTELALGHSHTNTGSTEEEPWHAGQ